MTDVEILNARADIYDYLGPKAGLIHTEGILGHFRVIKGDPDIKQILIFGDRIHDGMYVEGEWYNTRQEAIDAVIAHEMAHLKTYLLTGSCDHDDVFYHTLGENR